jgi:plastocyanin
MPVPRILFAVPVVVLGTLLPSAGAHIKPVPAGAVGMGHEGFSSQVVTIHRGQTLTLANNSRFMHTIGPGQDGTIAYTGAVPMSREMMQTNNVFTTGVWNTPGTYHLTCSVHPEMNVKVVVTN